MNNLEFRKFNFSDKSFERIESIRKNAFNINIKERNWYFYQNIKNKDFFVVECYLNNVLVGGAYISDSMQSLYIEQLFVKSEFQNSNMHIGSKIMEYIISNKNNIENFFNESFLISRLENRDNEKFYENLGYINENNAIGTMKRKL